MVSNAEIGRWEQMQYLGYLLGFAWLAGTGQAYLTRVRTLEKAAADRLTTQLLRITLGFSLGICLFAFVLQKPLLALLTSDDELPGWSFYLIFLASHWPALMYEQVLLAQSRARRLVWFSVLSNLALLTVLILPLLLGYGWAVSIQCLAVVALVKTLLIIDPKAWRVMYGSRSETSTTRPSDYQPTRLINSAFPLILYAIIGSLVVSFDPWLVNFWYDGDESQFVIFRYGTRELPLVAAIANGIGSTLLPLIGEDRSAGLAQLRKSSLRLMHLFFPLLFVLMLSSPWWWEPLFTEQFAASLPLFQIFLLSGISRFIMPVVIIMGTGHGKVLPGLAFVELLINAALSFWLVSMMGMAGIVWATVIVYTLDKVLAGVYIHRKEGVRLNDYCAWPWLVGYSLLLAGSYLLIDFLPGLIEGS